LHWTAGRTLASHAGAGPEAEADRAEADDELRNLYALNLRETNEILDRAQDRMSPILHRINARNRKNLLKNESDALSSDLLCPRHPCHEH
jgi:hypothetical protein